MKKSDASALSINNPLKGGVNNYLYGKKNKDKNKITDCRRAS
jgi:hypothetical protein